METVIWVIAVGFIFVIGASIGSFLNVVVYRVPAGLSIVWPASHCPHCRHPLGATENLPVLGWLLLSGRCRWCRIPISPRYPFVEAFTGLLFVVTFWEFGLSLTAFGYCVLLSFLLALSLIDLDTFTLPNPLTQGCLVLGLGYQWLQGWNAGQWSGAANQLMLGILGAVIGIWLLELISWMGSLVLGQQAMGGGDPKLGAAIGAWLGWQSFLVTGLFACAIGSVVGILAMVTRQLNRGHPIPFGPFLSLGALIAVFWGPGLIEAYLKFFNLTS